jgi:hypothetical protein
MKKLLLSTAMIAMFAIPSVHAEPYLKAGTKSEVPEYDTVNKDNLRSNVGIDAAMMTGNEIEEDNMQRYGNDFVNNAAEPMQNEMMVTTPEPIVPSMQNTGMQPTTPIINQVVQPSVVQNDDAVVVYDPVTQEKMMIQGQEAVNTINPNPAVNATVVAPQAIIVETIAVGNTDTGVDMDKVQKILQE